MTILNNEDKQFSEKLAPAGNYLDLINVEKSLQDSPEMLLSWQKTLEIAEAIKAQEGRVLITGGAVRDLVMRYIPNDIDLEVYGLERDKLLAILSLIGEIIITGKKEGNTKIHETFKLKISRGNYLDISLATKVVKNEQGDFEEIHDPQVSYEEAFSRRDITINAMGLDPLTGEIIDPFNGQADIKEKRLRVIDPEKFRSTPSRALRVMRFTAKLGFSPDQRCLDACISAVTNIDESYKEIVGEEWRKMLLGSLQPSTGVEIAHQIDLFRKKHQELQALSENDQDRHATKSSMDKAAQLLRMFNITGEKAYIIMLATLCHKVMPEERAAGKEYLKNIEKFLKEINVESGQSKRVQKIISQIEQAKKIYELIKFDQAPSSAEVRKLAKNLFPATIEEMLMFLQAILTHPDPENKLGPHPLCTWIIERALRLGVFNLKEKPKTIIQGEDLKKLGINPGKEFAEIINLCEEIYELSDMYINRPKLIQLMTVFCQENPSISSPTAIIEGLQQMVKNYQ